MWTVKEMMAENPCKRYTVAIVEKLWAGRESLSLAEVLALDIPTADRMWATWRPGALTKKQETALQKKIITRAITNHALHCKIESVEKWARKWLSGEDRSAAAEAAEAAAEEAEEAAWAAAAAWAAWAAEAAWAAWAAEAAAAEAAAEAADLLDLIAIAKMAME